MIGHDNIGVVAFGDMGFVARGIGPAAHRGHGHVAIGQAKRDRAVKFLPLRHVAILDGELIERGQGFLCVAGKRVFGLHGGYDRSDTRRREKIPHPFANGGFNGLPRHRLGDRQGQRHVLPHQLVLQRQGEGTDQAACVAAGDVERHRDQIPQGLADAGFGFQQRNFTNADLCRVETGGDGAGVGNLLGIRRVSAPDLAHFFREWPARRKGQGGEFA